MRKIRAAIKLVLFIAATLFLYSVWWLFALFVPNKQFWRQLAFGYWALSFVKISAMKIEVIGTPPVSPFFLVSNHLSYTDIAALRATFQTVFVAKAEINDWPIAGRIVRDMGVIFIDRQNRRDIPRAGEKIIHALNQGEGVTVFPEGTSTRGDSVQPFNSSFLEFAARTDLPVSYVAVTYRTPEDEPSAAKMVCWWEDISFMAHLFRLFTLREYTAVLTFGDEPVLDTDRKKLAAELRNRVSEHFIPVI